MKSTAILAAVALLAFALPARAQSDNPNSDDPNPVSLGDLARGLRQKKVEETKMPVASQPVIDNDNLAAVMDDVASHHSSHGLKFSFDGLGKKFQVSSAPDVTCSLSFTANATALLSDPYASRDLPPEELSKLDGPATLNGNTLEIAVHNGTGWSLKEITVGLTLLRHSDADEAYAGPARMMAAAATTLPGAEAAVPEEKRSDVTMLYRIKGAAAPASITIFREALATALPADQEWHWAIVEAKGYPPQTAVQPPAQPLIQSDPQAQIPARDVPQPQGHLQAPATVSPSE